MYQVELWVKVLKTIGDHPDIMLKELESRVDKGGLYYATINLDRKGYIERYRDVVDKRRKRHLLTRKGKEWIKTTLEEIKLGGICFKL